MAVPAPALAGPTNSTRDPFPWDRSRKTIEIQNLLPHAAREIKGQGKTEKREETEPSSATSAYRSHFTPPGPGMHRLFARAHVAQARGPFWALDDTSVLIVKKEIYHGLSPGGWLSTQVEVREEERAKTKKRRP